MSDCCSIKSEAEPKSNHLVIIGGGSAAFAAAIKASELGARVTIINDGLPIGGTCVNVGCVPSKTLIRAAEAHHRASHHNFHGIDSGSKIADFKAIISQKRQLVAELRQAKYIDILSDLPDVRLIEGRATFVDKKVVEVNRTRIAAEHIVIATGASPFIPPIPGLAESGYLTNETVFELEELPDSLIIIGGRYIALESAQLFARFGSKVTILQRSSRILPIETKDITNALTSYLSQEGVQVVTGISVTNFTSKGSHIVADATVNGIRKTFEASHILVATGREPNTMELKLGKAGIEMDSNGFLKVDKTLSTSVPGIYGAGDVIGDPMFVYTAAYEGALASENALLGTQKERDYTALPWVIFTDPQVAGVGLHEDQARKLGVEVDVVTLPLSQVPRAIAANDTRGFIRLIRETGTDKLVGARIIAPEGAEMLMELSLAIKHGINVSDLASSFHPYLTLSEGIKLAAIGFDKDIKTLSCCAV